MHIKSKIRPKFLKFSDQKSDLFFKKSDVLTGPRLHVLTELSLYVLIDPTCIDS